MASEQMCWESKQKLILERTRVRIKIRLRARVRHYLWLAACVFIYSESAGEPELMSGLEVELQSLPGLLVMAQSVLLWSATHTNTHIYIPVLPITLIKWGCPYTENRRMNV